MIINHNINSIISGNRADKAEKAKANAMGKLSSGLRINQASDDAAGSAISQKMKAQIRGLEQAQTNIQDGVSLVQTAEAGLGSIQNPNLVRMKELILQALNGTLSQEDRAKIQNELDNIKAGIDDIANNTEFNGIKLLNGSNPSGSVQTNINEIPLDYKDVLKMPTPNGKGELVLFTNKGYPTTVDDDDKRLVYGTGGTSYPSVIVNGRNYYFQNKTNINPAGTSISVTSDSIDNNKYVTKYRITDASNNVDVEVKQSVGIVADKYEIRYDIENKSSLTSTVGLEFNLDTDIADDDHAKFMVNGAVISQETLYSNSSNIPDSFNVYNQGGITNKIQACGILKTQNNPYNSSIKYEVLEEPSKFGIGQWNNGIESKNWTPSGNSSYSDSAYSIWYDEKTVNSGEIRSVNTFYGLSVPPTITQPDPQVIEHPYDIQLQVGPNSEELFPVELSDVRTVKLFQNGTSVETRDDANKLIKYVDLAMEKVSNERTKYGAYQNALEHIGSNVTSYGSNITSAESRISDADMAKEVMEMSKNSIIEQSAEAMEKQSENMTQSIIDLMSKWKMQG